MISYAKALAELFLKISYEGLNVTSKQLVGFCRNKCEKKL